MYRGRQGALLQTWKRCQAQQCFWSLGTVPRRSSSRKRAAGKTKETGVKKRGKISDGDTGIDSDSDQNVHLRSNRNSYYSDNSSTPSFKHSHHSHQKTHTRQCLPLHPRQPTPLHLRTREHLWQQQQPDAKPSKQAGRR